MIHLKKVSKRFGALKAVTEIDLELRPGQIHALLGPNGAGKTSTMRLITGYYAPDGGQVLIDGQDGIHRRPDLRAKIGYLPENNPLYGDMTVLEHLELAAGLRALRGPARRSAIAVVAERCQLTKLANATTATLSKGQRQRLGLAQALLGDPPILILDEPSSGLDPLQAEQLAQLVTELAAERTLLLSTHQLDFACQLCRQLFVLDAGRLVFKGDLAHFLASQPARGARLVSSAAEPELRRRLEAHVRVVAQEPHHYLLQGKITPDLMQRLFTALQGLPVEELSLLPATAQACFAALTTGAAP